jgi:hypothetical protein
MFFSEEELERTVSGVDAALRLNHLDIALQIVDITLQLAPDHPALLARRAVARRRIGLRVI